MKLDGFEIIVKDMATMVPFYRDVLGFGIKDDENTSLDHLINSFNVVQFVD